MAAVLVEVGLALEVEVGLALELVLVLVLGLGLLLGLLLGLGFEARRASSEAEVVIWGEDGEADGETDESGVELDGGAESEFGGGAESELDGGAESELDGELDDELDPEGDEEPHSEGDGKPDSEGDGEIGVPVGLLLGLVVTVEEVEEPEVEGDGVVGVGVGVGVGDFVGVGVRVGVGVGLGVGVLVVGSTWQLVSVLALVVVPGLSEAAATACAVPGRLTSTPRVRNPPPITLSAVTRTCAMRMKIACLRYSSGCCLLFVGSEATR